MGKNGTNVVYRALYKTDKSTGDLNGKGYQIYMINLIFFNVSKKIPTMVLQILYMYVTILSMMMQNMTYIYHYINVDSSFLAFAIS